MSMDITNNSSVLAHRANVHLNPFSSDSERQASQSIPSFEASASSHSRNPIPSHQSHSVNIAHTPAEFPATRLSLDQNANRQTSLPYMLAPQATPYQGLSNSAVINQPQSAGSASLCNKRKKTSNLQETDIPVVEMSAEIQTVILAWQEYRHGFCGKPALKELEDRYGPKWRSEQAKGKSFRRRLPIYLSIECMATKIEEDSAVSLLENYRVANKMSLFKLATEITARAGASRLREKESLLRVLAEMLVYTFL
jgi:Transcriptional activator of glycolytic enzymes